MYVIDGDNVGWRKQFELRNERIEYIRNLLKERTKSGKDYFIQELVNETRIPRSTVERYLYEYLEKEIEILKSQAMNEGKPAEIAEKMVIGRIGKFYGEICLIEQQFVKDPDIKISALMDSKKAKIVRFARLEKGEGIEKKEENFAEEVARQVKI